MPADYNGDGSADIAVFRHSNSTWYINGQGNYVYGTNGGVKCWGDNAYGQLGDGTNTDRLTPIDVTGLASNVSGVSTGGDHSCALTSTGAAKCWGENLDGQIGDGTLVDSNVPLNTVLSSSTTYTPDANHKHAVGALSTGESYAYDANGNMITRVEGGLTYTQAFDVENRLVSVTVSGQTTQFIYDGDGNLVKKIRPDGSRTIYVCGVYEVDKSAGGSVTRTVTYYPAAGAMRIDSTLYYVLKDHLGSASVVTNASGATVGEQRYYPFGETRLTTGTIFTDRLFTGQREMADLGIYHYGARFYSPYINQFLSADTIVPGYANPQNLNRFSYVLNNPLRYTDPTGHMQVDGNAGNHGSLNCKKYSQYCNNGTPKTAEELKRMRNVDQPCKNCHSESILHTTQEPEFRYTNYSSVQDWYVAGYDYEINWSQVDWCHLTTNGSGIVGDIAVGLTLVGILPAAPVAEFTQIIDVIGVTTDVIDFVSEGDFSGISLDVAQYVLKETKAVRIIPVVGFSSNIKGFSEALYRGSTKMPIWRRKPGTSAQP